MSQVYSDKSGARRGAKRKGLNPDLVANCEGGWIIIDSSDVVVEPVVETIEEIQLDAAHVSVEEVVDEIPVEEQEVGVLLYSPVVETPIQKEFSEPKVGKGALLLEMLGEWQGIDKLTRVTGWQPHTVRGYLSTMAKKHGFVVERKREEKLTSYMIVRSDNVREVEQAVDVDVQRQVVYAA